MQVKNTMRHHLPYQNGCCQREKKLASEKMWRRGNPCALLEGWYIGANATVNSMEVPQKIKKRTTIHFCNFSLGHSSKENENTNLKRYTHPYVHCSIIYNSHGMKAA